MPIVYLLGNPLVEEDSLPLKLLPKLKKEFKEIHFIELDPTENLPEEKHFIVIDTIINAKDIMVIRDIGKLEPAPNYSLHDFDLAFNLKLMKKLGKIKDVTIIGLPPGMDEKKAIERLKKVIPSSLSGNASRS